MGLIIRVVQVPDVDLIQAYMLYEIAREFDKMAREGIVFLNAKIAGWQNKTTMQKNVNVKPRKWEYRITHNSSTRAGQIFDWVDLGTGLEGPNRATYPIEPKNVPFLQFNVPHSPKTLAPGQSLPSGPRSHVRTFHVDHPGIKARKFTDELKENVGKEIVTRTHIAARRGLRKR